MMTTDTDEQVFIEVNIDDIVEELKPILDMFPRKGKKRYINFTSVSDTSEEHLTKTKNTTTFKSEKTPFIYGITKIETNSDSITTIIYSKGIQLVFKNSKKHKIFYMSDGKQTENLFVFTYYDNIYEEDIEYCVTFPGDIYNFFAKSLYTNRRDVLWNIIYPNINRLCKVQTPER